MSVDRNDLTNNAFKINGQYLEDIIEGYATLATRGREALSKNIETLSIGSANGETFKSSRYPSRTIEVDFLIKDIDDSNRRSKINHLTNILAADEADFIFNDEPDKYITGTPILPGEMSHGAHWISGTFSIFCMDPFKYSLVPIERTTDDSQGVVISGNTAIFTINYNGTHECHPTLRAEFTSAKSGGEYNEDGDCGYVAYSDDDGNIIQLGNPEALDIDAYTAAVNLANREFSSLEGWTASGWDKTWEDKAVDGSASVGSITDAHWASDTGAWAKDCAVPAFGSGTGLHGPVIWKQTTGAINYDLAIEQRLCCESADETGTFECGVWNTSGTPYMLTGYVIEKTANGTVGLVKYIVNGKIVGTDSIDLSYHNNNFGYCRKDAVYTTYASYTYYTNKKKKKKSKKKTKYYKVTYSSVCTGYAYTQSNLNSTIKKSEGTVTFKIGNLAAKTFTDSSISQIPAHNISMHFGKNGDMTPLNTNAVRSCKFTNNGNDNKVFADIPNVFTAGDIVEANCNDASVYLMRGSSLVGQYAPQFGALGNDWESFLLHKGTNHVYVSWNDWVDSDYKPKIKIIYNEVYI